MDRIKSNPLAWLFILFIVVQALEFIYMSWKSRRHPAPGSSGGWRILLMRVMVIVAMFGVLLEILDDGSSYVPGSVIVGSVVAILLLVWSKNRAEKRAGV